MANAKNSMTGRQQLFAAATAIGAVGLLMVPAPARAGPMFPLAPPCSQYGFSGGFALQQDNGFQVFFSATGPAVKGKAVTVGADNVTKFTGTATGGIQGRDVRFTVRWDGGGTGIYTGTVGDDGSVRRGVAINKSDANSAYWDSTSPPLGCLDAPPPPPPPIISATIGQQPPAGPAAARLGVAVNGPTTLRVGMSGSYTVNLSNPGDTGAPVELYVSFGGLQQTGQVISGGVNCEVISNASAVHCTVPQLQSKEQAQIVVQARGSAPGAGHLTVNINSADPGAQFVQRSQKLNVSIA